MIKFESKRSKGDGVNEGKQLHKAEKDKYME